jgi:hypothetical protein
MGFIERLIGGDVARAAAAWTSATAVDTAAMIQVKGFNTAVVTLRSNTTLTGGVITFEVSDDGTNWYPTTARRLNSFLLEGTYTLAASDTKSWRLDVTGFTQFRVRLSTVIAGTATVNIGVLAQMMAVPNSLVISGVDIFGNVLHDGVDSGAPVKVGSRAVAHGSNPAAVAAADRVDQLANRAGIPFVQPGHPNIITKSTRVTAAQTNLDLLGAISAGTKYVIVGFSIGVSKATTVNVGVKLGFGATTVPADGTAVAGVLFDHDGLEPGSGAVQGNGGGILAIGGDGEELRMTSDVPTTGALTVTIQYYTIES